MDPLLPTTMQIHKSRQFFFSIFSNYPIYQTERDYIRFTWQDLKMGLKKNLYWSMDCRQYHLIRKAYRRYKLDGSKLSAGYSRFEDIADLKTQCFRFRFVGFSGSMHGAPEFVVQTIKIYIYRQGLDNQVIFISYGSGLRSLSYYFGFHIIIKV